MKDRQDQAEALFLVLGEEGSGSGVVTLMEKRSRTGCYVCPMVRSRTEKHD